MNYTVYDFKESIDRSSIEINDVQKIIAAWGYEPDGWAGGFLMALKDGRFLYLTGWCDYAGWGCQDGIEETFFNEEPLLADLKTEADCEWELEPTDLNLIINK